MVGKAGVDAVYVDVEYLCFGDVFYGVADGSLSVSASVAVAEEYTSSDV